MSRSKTGFAIALTLLLATTLSMVILPVANAHSPPWTIPTWAYISVQPNPVGVGQAVFVNFWLDKVPPTAVAQFGDRWQGMEVTVTKPDGNTQKLGPFTSDDAGGAWTQYTPATTGIYKFVFNFPGQTIVGANPGPSGVSFNPQCIGDIYKPATSRIASLVVQEDPVAVTPDTPLPTGYWTRPIFADNTAWYKISGNWLGAGGYNNTGNFDPYTKAPNTGHIVWTKPYAPGGLIGGEYGYSRMNSNYYSTAQYETKFSPIIMNGILYFTLVPGSSMSPEGWVAVDIRTGEEVWFKNTSTSLLRGQLYDYVSPNQFGALAYLWDTHPTKSPNKGTTYGMYDAMTGNWILDIANGTSATFVSSAGGFASQGDMLGYYINTTDWTLNLWNSSKCIIGPMGAVPPGGYPPGWMWRPTQGATIPWDYGIEWSVPMAINMTASNGTVVNINKAYAESAGVASNLAIRRIGDVILVDNIPGPTISHQQPGYFVAEAYSLEDGHLLWGPLNQTQPSWVRLSGSAIGEGVYTIFEYESQSYTGYSTQTGQKLWGPVSVANETNPWGYYVTSSLIAYGNLYSTDFGGFVNCLDVKTGAIKWTFWTGSSGLNSPYGVYPIVNFQAIADGKLYVNGGHLYSPPLFHGGRGYCINATTGQLIWSMPDFAITNGAACALADGFYIRPNAYDNRLYCYGKGQSATTVSAPETTQLFGTPILVRGTITDQSPGETCLGVPAKGTPAIADESMSAWMEYLYMQQEMPTNAKGVEVIVEVFDPNSNYYEVGRTTSDAAGFYSLAFTPEVPGKYTIVARFAGSESYYSSFEETAINVVEATSAATPVPTQAPASMADLYFLPVSIGLFVAIAAVLVMMMLMFRKR